MGIQVWVLPDHQLHVTVFYCEIPENGAGEVPVRDRFLHLGQQVLQTYELVVAVVGVVVPVSTS